MKISITIGVFMLLGVGCVNAQLPRPPRSDTQNWNDVYLSVPLARRVDFLLQATLRNGRDLTRPVDERFGIGFSFKLGKYLTITPNYLYIETQPFEGRRLFEDRLSVTTNIRIPIGHFVLADRNIFERRFRRPGSNSTRYRNRLQAEHPIGPVKEKISLFVYDEVYYDWSFNAWVRNRASVGVSKVVNKHLTFDLYYLRQNDSHSVPGDLHVFGTAWRFKL
ncbi:MAG TPA: DUF2490 domain-containing protein [Pyrinomonadaceae bacterium]|nr:DUF2490 domain-containing protein [Pyrinomonadaceae bacterium]